MDNYKAQRISEKYIGNTINGYKITELIDNGKSAAVFKTVNKANSIHALKIFDNEIIGRFGQEIQEVRIKKEIEIKNISIDNLIHIIDGGKGKILDEEVYYVVMPFLEGVNLKKYIINNEITSDFIAKVSISLLDTSEQLLQHGIVHRDIKPENIMVTTNGDIILMDLGVVKNVGATSISDIEEKQFLGTLRYSPPEFLKREEEDSTDGWRAVNLYQIGCVMHDLIMRKELFHDISPYAKLVESIFEDIPLVSNPNYKYDVQQLTNDLLIKDWKRRLQLCSIPRIKEVLNSINVPMESHESILDNILQRTQVNKKKLDELQLIQRSRKDREAKILLSRDNIISHIHEVVSGFVEKGICIEVVKSEKIRFDDETGYMYRQLLADNMDIHSYIYELKGNLSMGYIGSIALVIRIMNDHNNYARITVAPIFVCGDYDLRINTTGRPESFLKHIVRKTQPIRINQVSNNNSLPYSFEPFTIFDGAVSFDDGFSRALKSEFSKILSKAFEVAHPFVQEKLDLEINAAKNNTSGFVYHVPKPLIIVPS